MNRQINIQFNDITGRTKRFDGLRELLNFLKSEVKFWKEKRESLKDNKSQVHPALGFHAKLNNAITSIESWSSKLESWNDDQLQQQINNLKQQVFIHAPGEWLWSGHPFNKPFVDCHNQHGIQVATAFLNYVTKQKISNLNSPNDFLGVMIAYEFLYQDSDLLKRRNGERISLGHLRNQLEDTTNKLIGETEAFKEDFNSWDENSRENWTSWLEQASIEHGDQQTAQKDEFNTYMKGCRTKIAELENTYQEKLRLEKPAQYWKNAARKYGVQGGLWSLSLVASVLLGLAYFSNFFSSWLVGHSMGVDLNKIQGIIIFGTIIAVYTFLVRTLSRLTFSSFHLMRDAEEREQLTYLYLSLVNDKKLDESSRDIVLQALFSRSETGLLVSESGPTMPGVGEVIKSAAKIR